MLRRDSAGEALVGMAEVVMCNVFDYLICDLRVRPSAATYRE